MSGFSRLRLAMTEVVLAAAGMLLGVASLMLLRAVGLFSGDGVAATIARFVGGPLVTLIGVFAYRALAKLSDESQARGEPAVGKATTALSRSTASPLIIVGWVALGIGAAIGGSYVLGIVLELLGAPVAEQSGILEITERVRTHGPTLEFSVLALAALVLAPVAEEWLFRGLLFRRILGAAGALEAFAFSAAAFAAIHTNPAGFVIYMWLGVVFAETYRRTGRLWSAVLVHMGNNAFALTLLVVG